MINFHMDPKICVVLTLAVVVLSTITTFGSCLSIKSLSPIGFTNNSAPAVATWYGPPTGAGSGGACGFENDVTQPPFSAKISAGNQAIFKSGKGCGSCYSVLCTQNPSCSGRPITVTITDECPGACNNDPIHFDLSGTAFGLLAKPGQQNALRNAGRINISYQRVPCSYPNQHIVFKVDKGSNQFYFSTAVEYENGDGDIGTMEIQHAGSTQFFPMKQVFGATYKYDIPAGTSAPFTIRLTQIESGRTVVAKNVIPGNWKPGQKYTSSVNY